MQISDEMVEAARHVLRQQPNDVHGALEAALGAKPTSDLINKLRDTATNRFHPPRKKSVEQEIEWKAAACIEDLAGALKKTNGRLYRLCECASESGCNDAALREENSVTLERWGLK